VREERLSLAQVAERYGEAVAQLLTGVLRMAAISDLRNPSDSNVLGQAERQRDNIRKMLVAMVDDVRVALSSWRSGPAPSARSRATRSGANWSPATSLMSTRRSPIVSG
jgi:hypothetical protein